MILSRGEPPKLCTFPLEVQMEGGVDHVSEAGVLSWLLDAGSQVAHSLGKDQIP